MSKNNLIKKPNLFRIQQRFKVAQMSPQVVHDAGTKVVCGSLLLRPDRTAADLRHRPVHFHLNVVHVQFDHGRMRLR